MGRDKTPNPYLNAFFPFQKPLKTVSITSVKAVCSHWNLLTVTGCWEIFFLFRILVFKGVKKQINFENYYFSTWDDVELNPKNDSHIIKWQTSIIYHKKE